MNHPWTEIGAWLGLAACLSAAWVFVILIGTFVRSLFSDLTETTGGGLFDSFLVGVVATAVSLAVVVSGGQTLMVAVLPVVVLAAGRPRIPTFKNFGAAVFAALREIPFILTLFEIPLFLVQRGSGSWPLGLPHWDDIFFGRLSLSLYETGCENVRPYLSLLQARPCGVATYHYAEEWLGGAVALLTGGSPSHVLLFVIGPLLIAGAWIGIQDLLEPSVVHTMRRRLLSAGILLLPAPHFRFLATLHPLEEANAFGGMNLFDLRAGAAKQAVVVLALVAVLRAIDRRQPRYAVLVLLGLIPFSASAAPAALTCAVALALLQPAAERRRLLICATLLVTALVGVLGFAGERQSSMHSVDSILSIAGSAAGLGTRVNIVGKSLIQLFVAFSPWWITLAFASRVSNASQLIFGGTVTAALAGVLGYGAVFQLPDAPQFATRFPTLLLQIAGAVFVARSVIAGRRLSAPVFGAVLSLGAAAHVLADRMDVVEERANDYRWRQSETYLQAARTFRPKTSVGGFLVSPAELTKRWDPSRPVPTFTPHVYTVGSFIGVFPQYRAVSLISPPDETEDPRRFALAQFAPEWQGSLDVLATQARIIETYCVSFIVASREATLPAVALGEVAKDSVTGERLLEVMIVPPHCKPLVAPPATFWRTLFAAQQ